MSKIFQFVLDTRSGTSAENLKMAAPLFLSELLEAAL